MRSYCQKGREIMSDESAYEEELRKDYPITREIPATYVNNFFVTGSPVIIRIVFGESADEPVGTKYRVAVAMPLDDARELVRVVSEMIAEIDQDKAPEKEQK